jgi:Zn-dependent protease
MTSLLFALLGLVALVISLTVHEFSHALAAYLLGDETAKRQGRLTLNPIPHIDPVGTLLIPFLAALSHLPLLGWAKPVPVNPYNLRPAKWGDVAVSLAGPGSNAVMALVFALGLRLAVGAGLPSDNLAVLLLSMLVMVNVVLCVFNLLPLPPLDGSKVLIALLDAPHHQPKVRWLERNGFYLLLGLIFVDAALPQPLLGGLFVGASRLVFGVVGLDAYAPL